MLLESNKGILVPLSYGFDFLVEHLRHFLASEINKLSGVEVFDLDVSEIALLPIHVGFARHGFDLVPHDVKFLPVVNPC